MGRRPKFNAGIVCPSGHSLPNRTDKGACTPVYCPDPPKEEKPKAPPTLDEIAQQRGLRDPEVRARVAAKRKEFAEQRIALKEKADELINKMLPDTFEYAEARDVAIETKAEELKKLGSSVGRLAAARAFFKVPGDLEGAEAEQYVQKKALSLAPEALMEIERQLRLGDDSQRREAARDILDMNGMRRKEAAPGNGPVIMLVNPGGGDPAPWVKRVTPPVLPGKGGDK